MRRRVLFLGAYGIGSAGDDAPLLVLADALRRRHPDVAFDLVVAARHPDPVLEGLGGVRFVENLEHASRESARGRWFRGLNPGDDPDALVALSREVARADLVVAGAGNFLVDLTIDVLRGPVPLFATYAFLADLHRTPFLLYGISAGPLSTRYGRDLARWIVRRSAAVTCRDEASRALLAALAPEAAVRLLPDPVLGLAPACDEEIAALLSLEGIPAEEERPRLALALRDLAFLGFDRRVLVEALRVLARTYDLLFVPQCTYPEGDDRAEARAIAAQLGGARCHLVEGRHAPAALMRLYETADATLAIRLHGAVFSAMAGVAPASIAYLPKVAGFHASLGLEDLALPLQGLTPEAIVAAVERSRAVERRELRARCASLGREVQGYAHLAGRLLGLEPGLEVPRRQASA